MSWKHATEAGALGLLWKVTGVAGNMGQLPSACLLKSAMFLPQTVGKSLLTAILFFPSLFIFFFQVSILNLSMTFFDCYFNGSIYLI